MDKSQAEGRDRGGYPGGILNIRVPNNQLMVQHERNNTTNIGNPRIVGNAANADNGNGTGRNPVSGGGGVAAERRRRRHRRWHQNRGGGGSNTATGSGPSGGNQIIVGSRDGQPRRTGPSGRGSNTATGGRGPNGGNQHIAGSRNDQPRRTEPGGMGSNTAGTGGRGPSGGNQLNPHAPAYEWRRRETVPPVVGGNNSIVPDTGNQTRASTQQTAQSSDDQPRPRAPGDGSRNTHDHDQQHPRAAGGVGSSSTAPGNGGFGRGIGGILVPPLLGRLMTEQGLIPCYGVPIGQMTSYGEYSYVDPATHLREMMMNGGVALPLMRGQRMMDQFYGMINPAAFAMGGQTGSIYQHNRGWEGDVRGQRSGEPSNREEAHASDHQQRQTDPGDQGRLT